MFLNNLVICNIVLYKKMLSETKFLRHPVFKMIYEIAEDY